MSLHNILLAFCMVIFSGQLVQAQVPKHLEYFDLADVRLLPSAFKRAETTDKNYLLTMDADRLLTPFLREAGLPTKKPSYSNWENTGLDGHIGGHYLSALALMYASTGDTMIKERLDYMIKTLKQCQDANADGYIGGVPGGKGIWQDIRAGKIKAGGFSLNDKWVPLYNIHKTYAGLRDAYLLAGDTTAKKMLISMSDWAIRLVEQLSEQQIQDMLRSEHGGLNETFADVAAITQDPKYIRLARQFSHQSILDPLLRQQDNLTGMHANTQIPKVLGFKRIADVAQDSSWNNAARYFWDNVVEHRSIAFGGNSVSEHFNPIDDFSKMVHSVEGPETCNTYNMLRLTKMLYQSNPQGKYLDYYERALYNHILSTQHPEHGGFVYFTQIRPGHYRVYSQPHSSMWCCVGSGMENHGKYGEMIYAHSKNDLFVNLFIPSRVHWQEKAVVIEQVNTFPEEAWTELHIDPAKKTTFTLRIRKPQWLTGEAVVTVNSKPYTSDKSDSTWISIRRSWKKGDKVRIDLPMGIHTEQLPDHSNYYSILYGPIVLAARSNNGDTPGLLADDSRMGHVAQGRQIPLSELPVLSSEPSAIPQLVNAQVDKPLHFTLSGVYLGREAVQMTLEPFYKIHDSRYIMYWPQATATELHNMQEKLARDEQETLALAARTMDRVVCGEQQPESDHFIKEEQTTAGVFDDVRWREAKGWFSYQLKKESDKPTQLYLKYLAEGQDRITQLLVNDELIGQVEATNSAGDDNVRTVVFDLPDSFKAAKNIQVKIAAKGSVQTHKILEVRLLKP
ncbi:glycoside hydrolase family 127 protein [Sphingobacterium bambusae]|uniref:Glycoside hydrolase family 127 protein n=1 Tax=Sphingobacterium bambusae TaxID=662858 RepID=A0ABW6BEL9_9SPHI|nr:glycoside hydrolase family 127 protein [Sphingobacterium bambusae]WPL50516.1 glycoside hydrolase family 127 protein [Sphingobacterium bambusae]